MEKYGTARHAENYNMAHALCMLVGGEVLGGRGEREIENMQLSNAFTWQQRLHKRLSMILWQATQFTMTQMKVPLFWAH